MKRPRATENSENPAKAKRGRPLSTKKKRPDALPNPIRGRSKAEKDAEIDLVLADANFSQRDMAARLRVSLSTVQRYIHQRKSSPVTPKSTSKQNTQSKRLREAIRAVYSENPRQTSPQIVQTLSSKHQLLVSRTTVWRVLVEDLGLQFKKRSQLVNKIPAAVNTELRRKFATAFLEIAKTNPIIIWTDETQAGSNNYHHGGFASEGQEPTEREKQRWAPHVNCWGAMWENGAYVVKVPKGKGKRGGTTKAQYIKFISLHLKNIVARVKKNSNGRPIYWMQDGASVHGQKETIELCKKHNINFLSEWPAHSSDLNPIEDFWTLLKRAIAKDVQLPKHSNKHRTTIDEKISAFAKHASRRMLKKFCNVGKKFGKVRRENRNSTS
jgi:transposase